MPRVTPELQTDLLQRALRHCVRNTTDAQGGATRFPALHYVDEARLQAERRAALRRRPVVVGCSTELPQPGDFLTREADGLPLLLLRQADGSAAVFLNICRHRGARVVTAPSGHVDGRMTCPYHAWSYRPDGSLRNVPCSIHFQEVDRGAQALRRLPSFEAGGLLFAHLDPSAARPSGGDEAAVHALAPGPELRTCLDQLESFGLHRYELYATRTVPAAMNWKMMVEANREGYHIHVLHRDTAALRFRPQMSLLDAIGEHSRAALIHKGFGPAAMAPDAADWRILDHADVAYFLFPNTLVLLGVFAAHVLTAHPQGPHACTIYGATLVPPGTRETYPREFYDVYWATILEDIAVSVDIQRAAAADPQQQFWAGANEWLLPHFHASLQAAIDDAPP